MPFAGDQKVGQSIPLPHAAGPVEPGPEDPQTRSDPMNACRKHFGASLLLGAAGLFIAWHVPPPWGRTGALGTIPSRSRIGPRYTLTWRRTARTRPATRTRAATHDAEFLHFRL